MVYLSNVVLMSVSCTQSSGVLPLLSLMLMSASLCTRYSTRAWASRLLLPEGSLEDCWNRSREQGFTSCSQNECKMLRNLFQTVKSWFPKVFKLTVECMTQAGEPCIIRWTTTVELLLIKTSMKIIHLKSFSTSPNPLLYLPQIAKKADKRGGGGGTLIHFSSRMSVMSTTR